MGIPQLKIPHKTILTRQDYRLGEALSAIKAFVNTHLATQFGAGNKPAALPVSLVNPTKRPG